MYVGIHTAKIIANILFNFTRFQFPSSPSIPILHYIFRWKIAYFEIVTINFAFPPYHLRFIAVYELFPSDDIELEQRKALLPEHEFFRFCLCFHGISILVITSFPLESINPQTVSPQQHDGSRCLSAFPSVKKPLCVRLGGMSLIFQQTRTNAPIRIVKLEAIVVHSAGM